MNHKKSHHYLYKPIHNIINNTINSNNIMVIIVNNLNKLKKIKWIKIFADHIKI
jgi:hypothetical protein